MVFSSYHRVFKSKQAFTTKVESKHKAKKLIDSEYICRGGGFKQCQRLVQVAITPTIGACV